VRVAYRYKSAVRMRRVLIDESGRSTPYFEDMVGGEPLDPNERAAEKRRSRAEDGRALESGEKSREQLKRENGLVLARNVFISLRGTKPLE
jgi:hypothetical protein